MPQAIAESVFSGLEPVAVWAHFARLCRIPRQSKAEGPLRDEIRQWALAKGLVVRVDGAGNLLIRKPASVGREDAPVLVVQAHLDMVCQKNPGVAHDFSRDPIRPVYQDGWLVAEDTTLGADNGIGVALILAVLEDASLVHGPIEALLTVDEEAGMGGARGLEAGVLKGRLLLNLDTEQWGEFFMG
ncbi:MAG: M20/M25/M40 family metallo-hydrolase, partial [Candidatus Accumulibacter sp.]|nr:M20/M25/M40 family metallo-hydrolase [Accumulibacter sp.]